MSGSVELVHQNQLASNGTLCKRQNKTEEDVDLLKWSVPDILRVKFDKCLTSQNVETTLIANFETAAKTSTMRNLLF